MAAWESSYGGGWSRGPGGLRVESSLLALPELCVEETGEEGDAPHAAHAVAPEGWFRIGELADAQAGEQAEGGVERRNVEAGEAAEEGVGREGEVADEPEG